MTTKWTRTESQMLEKVRRWRREVYEGDQRHADEDRVTRLRELADRFGLPVARPRPSHQSGPDKKRA